MTLLHRFVHRPGDGGGLLARQQESTTTTTSLGLLPSPAVTATSTGVATTEPSPAPSSSGPSGSSTSSTASAPSTTGSSSTLPSGSSSSSSSSSSSIPSSASSITLTTTVQPTTISTSSLSTSSSSTELSHLSRVVSTNADGGVVTITTLVDAPTSSATSAGNSDGDGVGFLQNKAAMGATFAVAGIAALVFAFLFITTCIRRRRAMKFDRDVAAAAAIAAAESQAIRPYDDDDDDVFTVAPRAQGGGYGYAPGKMAEHDPYSYAAAGVVGGSGPGAFGAPAQPMRQQQTGGPLAYPTAQQYPVQPFDQSYNGGAFGRQVGHQEVYNLQDLGVQPDIPRRPGSAGTGHDSLPGIAGVGTQGSVSGTGPGPGRGNGMTALVGAAGLASGAVAAAGSAYRNQHDDPYGGYVSSPIGESRYPHPRWSQQQGSLPAPVEQQQSGWHQQYGQVSMQQQQQQHLLPSPTATPAPAYSPSGGLTAQGYPNEKSTYSNARSVTSAQTLSVEGPSASTSGGHTVVSTDPPGTPQDEDDVGSILEETEGPRVLKVTNE